MALSWTWAKQLDPGSVPLSSFLACCVSLRFRFPLAGNLMKEVSPCHGRVLFDRVVVSFHLSRCMSLAYFRYLVHGHPFDNGSISLSEQRARALQISAMPCRHGLFLKSSPMIAERRTELTAHHCPCACFITMSPTEHDSRCQYLLPAYITCELWEPWPVAAATMTLPLPKKKAKKKKKKKIGRGPFGGPLPKKKKLGGGGVEIVLDFSSSCYSICRWCCSFGAIASRSWSYASSLPPYANFLTFQKKNHGVICRWCLAYAV